MLLFKGDRDELVPTFHMIRLHELASNSAYADFYSVRGGTHNDTWERGGQAYYIVSCEQSSLHHTYMV